MKEAGIVIEISPKKSKAAFMFRGQPCEFVLPEPKGRIPYFLGEKLLLELGVDPKNDQYVITQIYRAPRQ